MIELLFSEEKPFRGASQQPFAVVVAEEVEGFRTRSMLSWYLCSTTWNGQSLSHMQRSTPNACTTFLISGARSV